MTNNENQKFYDTNKTREKHCTEWLKSKKRGENRIINSVAMIGILKGVLIIIQSALLAYIFQKLVIDKLLWNELLSFFLALGIIFIFRGICNYFIQTLGFKIAINIKRTIREELFNKFLQLGPAYIKQHQSGELAATTLENTEAFEGYFARYLPHQIVVAVLPLIMIAVVMPINWVVGVIFLITGPLVPLFMALVGMGAASANRDQFLAMARMSGYFLDRLQGLTTLRMFGQANAELVRISKVASDFREKTMEVLRIAFLSSAILEFFSAVAVALVAVYVGLGLLGLVHFGPAENISLQEALFVLLLAPEFFDPLKKLASYYHDKAAAIGAADHILKVLEYSDNEEKKAQSSGANKSEFCIELQSVSKFHQQKQILKEFCLQIQAGEKIAITGKSGVGKTTLFNLLLGFESTTSGTVLINGEHASRENASKNFALAGQAPTIFYATINDNISLLNPKISQQQINTAAKAAGVTEYSQSLDKGLLTQVGEKGYGLSGGQIQRIALARAFVSNAPILLLDEPTAHLDADNKTKLLNEIESGFKDKTLIIASHDVELIERMDRAICIS